MEPAHGVICGLVKRASAGLTMIHGLMWDVWRVFGVQGGFLKGLARNQDASPSYLYWNSVQDVERFQDRAVRERIAAIVRRAREVDAQAIADLRLAGEEWERCRGQGNLHRCFCREGPCTRV